LGLLDVIKNIKRSNLSSFYLQMDRRTATLRTPDLDRARNDITAVNGRSGKVIYPLC